MSPILAILIMYILKWDISLLISKFIPSLEQAIKTKPGLSFTINTSLIALFLNLFIKIFKNPGKLEIEIKSARTRKDNSILDIKHPNRKIALGLDCNMNFRYIWLRDCIMSLGNIRLTVHIPHWVDYVVDNQQDFKQGVITSKRDEDKLEISLGHAIRKQCKDGKFYVLLKLGPNVKEQKEDYIVSEFTVESNGFFKKIISQILIFLFLDFKASKHLVEARNDS
ncbi:hypothetical protein [Peribacillus frigoritolerans]|uniref:hypothetical protein n=1 Tax=Peribacillus frigoritolerans TaxID=450367 RepID=UPI002079A211|nr:hypothetical protein [Peribacillus frigoritolerans]USK74792.1 hypothetical protein LIT31_24145 [Peribacillus frigoritolerans]